ncbi:MAG: FkbM family methyltransferase [Pararhodobacter sp.]
MKTGQPLAFHIARNRHGQYCVPAESLHRPCAIRIMQGGVWEGPTLAAIARIYRGGDIVTAGAYFGDFLPFLSRLADSHGAHVWAFEPNTVNHLCASVTCSINTLANCTLTRGGLGARPGVLTVKTHDDTGLSLGGASRVVEGRPGSARARFDEVAIHTIDAMLGAARVGLIQLDVEGHELAALEGACAVIARDHPLLVLEAHGKVDLAQTPEIAALCEDLGYREIGRFNQNLFLAAGEAAKAAMTAINPPVPAGG